LPKGADGMTNDEKILTILTQMQSDLSDVKSDVADLKSDVTDLKSDVTNLKSDVTDLKSGQERLSQNIVRLEIELVPKVTALFDGYSLRGDQITHLKEDFYERFQDFREDVSYLLSKTAKQEREIAAVFRQKKVSP